jgi:hypothetical protein
MFDSTTTHNIIIHYFTPAKHHHHDSLNPAATAHHIHIIKSIESMTTNINKIGYISEAGLSHIFSLCREITVTNMTLKLSTSLAVTT